ncbi:protein FAM169B isoform X1 [Anguilla rostrata]|uniref:protein FAM169B isoform X1 n=1 Tax=Anguilla rostrata TaxID=7938 RepID=UPI0030CBE647
MVKTDFTMETEVLPRTKNFRNACYFPVGSLWFALQRIRKHNGIKTRGGNHRRPGWISVLTNISAGHNSEENYPVDTVFLNYNTLKKSAEDFMTCLETNSPSENDWFILPSGAKVEVSHNNIKHLSLFGNGDPMHTILALCEPTHGTHAIAVYLNGTWWTVSNVLKTSNTSRSGLVRVQSVGERVVLFLLSQVIFGVLERPPDADACFAPHPEKEVAKILWQDGEAAGFYTVKQKGALCDGCSGLCYLLPVLDTVFVRTQFRRRGLALRMLEDFCVSYAEEEFIGISRPVSSGMSQVCRKYLQAQERDRDRLYEVEAPGGWAQRRNVWLSLQLSRCSAHSETDRLPQEQQLLALHSSFREKPV